MNIRKILSSLIFRTQVEKPQEPSTSTNIDSVFSEGVTQIDPLANDDLFAAFAPVSVNPTTWFDEIKKKFGESQDLEQARKFISEFDYDHEPNEALTNSNQFLKFLEKNFIHSTKLQNYQNPNSQAYGDILPGVKKLAEQNGLMIKYQSALQDFAQSKSVAILIADKHDDLVLQKKTANFLLDLYSGDIPLSSGFVENQFEEKASELYQADVSRDQVDKLVEEKFAPESILKTLLPSSNPALAFQAESLNTMDSSKLLIRQLLVLETLVTNNSSIIEDRNYGRELLHKFWNSSFKEGLGYEYLAGLCLSARKILDKETNFDIEFKRHLYQKLFRAFLDYRMVLQPKCPTELTTSFEKWDQSERNKLSNRVLLDTKLQKEFHSLDQSNHILTRERRVTRNYKMAEAFINNGYGTRVMRLGANHLSDQASGDSNVRRLLEEAGFAVVVLG